MSIANEISKRIASSGFLRSSVEFPSLPAPKVTKEMKVTVPEKKKTATPTLAEIVSMKPTISLPKPKKTVQISEEQESEEQKKRATTKKSVKSVTIAADALTLMPESRSRSLRTSLGSSGKVMLTGGQKKASTGKSSGGSSPTARHSIEEKFAKQFSKTSFCFKQLEGKCRRGTNCQFAHSVDELRARPVLDKTKMCTKSGCTDTDCRYAHSRAELKATIDFAKTKVCHFGDKCKNGDTCRYAHDATEINKIKDSIYSKGRKTEKKRSVVVEESKTLVPLPLKTSLGRTTLGRVPRFSVNLNLDLLTRDEEYSPQSSINGVSMRMFDNVPGAMSPAMVEFDPITLSARVSRVSRVNRVSRRTVFSSKCCDEEKFTAPTVSTRASRFPSLYSDEPFSPAKLQVRVGV